MLNWRTLGDLLEQLPCLELGQAPEIFGPTACNAQSGNGGLSVALNRAGTVTVCRWPRPSFYDQVKHRATDRDAPRMGAAPNAGAFLGLAVDVGDGPETRWLRDWDHEQEYPDPHSDVVATTYRHDVLGLSVTVRDVVAPDDDVLVRDVHVEAEETSPVEDASLVAFENWNLVVSKEERNPVQDWCHEGENTDAAHYRPDADAVVHTKEGVDESTGDPASVALAMGFAGESAGHQVGGDAHEPAAAADDDRRQDAFEDAADGRLRGNDRYEGHTTGALRRPLDLTSGAATATVLVTAAPAADPALSLLADYRDRDPDAVRADKRAWFDDLVGDAPMPACDDPAVRTAARRALVTVVTNFDSDSGAMVASIATQSPYNLDWPRDGAYFNHVLDMLGLHDWVATHNRWYADLQRGPDDPPPAGLDIPVGSWAMNYYADGTVGGPIPWEIDETALAAWTLYDHYAVTGDEDYLHDVYPAIRRTAELFVDHVDEDTGLPAPAHEDDNVLKSQTVVGAGAVWLALDAAAEAASVVGREGDQHRYEARRDELAAAIDDHLWDERQGAYSRGARVARLREWPVLDRLFDALPLAPGAVAEPSVAWPIGFRPLADDRMERHIESMWADIEPTFDEPAAGDHEFGLYDTKSLLALAKAWRGDEDKMERVRDGLRWVAHEHATDDTRVMGEIWRVVDDEVITAISQPHAWTQVLFYYAALEAWPPADVDDLEPGYVGAIERLRGTD